MYFKKLEIVGFKSFLHKTVLEFEPGITAVVGPNGAGKSNVFDGIRWVLGEQSVKSLRGSDMQDVIFNGTDTKEPLSMAEVSLSFDNDKRFFNVDHHEVVITRRIFRSGESEYLLNKTQVRLKDILDLLMGTGIGAESYSLVEQGKIDLVLSSRPEDRRLVFDEAAGITKYKAQKKETLRKLEDTEQNLLRVNDIINEVKRQIGSLERQANKARKYKEVFDELKQKEIELAVCDKNELIREKDALIRQLDELEIAEQNFLKTIQLQESRNTHQRTELKALEDNIMSVKNQLLSLDSLALGNKERISFNQEKISELEKNQKYLEAQIEQTANRLILDEKKLNGLNEERTSIHKNILEKEALFKEKEGQLGSLNSSTKISLDNIAKTKKSILELVTRQAQVKNEIADTTSKLQVYLARKKRLEIEKAKVGEEKAVIQKELYSLKLQLQGLENEFQELNRMLSNAKKRLAEETANLEILNSEVSKLEKEKLTLESHKEFLGKLKTKYEDISESMNATIYLDKRPLEAITGLVVKIKDAHKLEAYDAQGHKEAQFKLSGEAKPFDLDPKKMIKELDILQKKISDLEARKNESQGRIANLNQDINAFSERLRNQELTLANKKSSYEAAMQQFNKIKEEDEVIALELSDLKQEASELENTLASGKSGLSEVEHALKGCEDLILQEQNNINSNSALKEETLVAITKIKTELEGLSKRLDSDQATFKILEDTYQQDKDNLSNFQNQVKDGSSKKEFLISEIRNLEMKIQQTQSAIQKQGQGLKELENEYQKISVEISGSVENLETDRKELDSLKNKLYDLQAQNKDVDFKIISIKDRLLQIYKVDLNSLCDITLSEIDRVMLVDQIKALKEKLDSYGTVNLVAIEEYDELKKRYDFLTHQQNDLITARQSIHDAITKINRTTRKMFLETFEKIRQEFRNYFRLLFNGGDAQIFLIDEQDPLESGIEIICRPPGKKLQNVLLLSGGEKSMSAIALIFAIFKIKPSPFCVLDEIDAALDEANVDRFSRMLSEFARDSQFIVITHNKKTIANANVMYGITMEESGVSKIVSVKFKQDRVKEPDKEVDMAVVEPV